MFIVGTTFSFKVFFQTLNSLFVVLFHCQKGKKAQQTFQGAAGSLPVFRRVYWIVKLFSQYCLQRASKQPKTSNLILSRSSNYIVDVVMRPNFDYSSIFMIEVIITQILDGFDQKTNFEGWPSLKFNNLRLVRGMALKFYCSVAKGLTLKQLWGWQGGQSIWLPSCGLSKNVSSKERVKPWFFVTFNIIIGHIFPEDFIEIHQVFQKTWRISPSILAIFIIFLLQRK